MTQALLLCDAGILLYGAPTCTLAAVPLLLLTCNCWFINSAVILQSLPLLIPAECINLPLTTRCDLLVLHIRVPGLHTLVICTIRRITTLRFLSEIHKCIHLIYRVWRIRRTIISRGNALVASPGGTRLAISVFPETVFPEVAGIDVFLVPGRRHHLILLASAAADTGEWMMRNRIIFLVVEARPLLQRAHALQPTDNPLLLRDVALLAEGAEAKIVVE